MLIDELKELLRVQLPPAGPHKRIASLRVAPDVWNTLMVEVPRTSDAPVFGWRVIVDKYLEPGSVIPCDENGQPIERPRPSPSTETK